MQFLTAFAVILYATVSVAADIEILPPDEKVAAGRQYLLEVRGLSDEHLTRATLIVEPRASTKAIGVRGWEPGQHFIWFRAADKGRRFLAIAIGQADADGNVIHPDVTSIAIDVGGDPSPDPPPPPPPPPPPTPGKLAVIVVYESEAIRDEPYVTITVLGLQKYLDSRKIWWRTVDKDGLRGDTRQAPKWLEVAKASIKQSNLALPSLVVGKLSSGEFVPVAAEVLPATAEAAVDIVKRYEGFSGVLPETSPTSLFVPTPMDVVERMLCMAKPKPGETLVDLGSGDGRIVIYAAKKYGCKAIGYEIDPDLVALSRRNAEECGVQNLVTFEERDVRNVNLKKAAIVTLYLDSTLGRAVAPKLLSLKLGSRVVSHQHPIPDFPVDRVSSLSSEETRQKHTVYLTQIPSTAKRLPGPSYGYGRCGCVMCLGNHILSSHRYTRARLDCVHYSKWHRLHDNLHNHGKLSNAG